MHRAPVPSREIMLDIRKRKSLTRERVLAEGIQEVVAELRLVDVVDYVAFLRLEHFGNVSDIVSSSSELFLKPGVLRFAGAGQAQLSWSTKPIIVLALEFRHAGVTVHFQLELGAAAGAVDITYVAFEEPSDECEIDRISNAISDARLLVPRAGETTV